MSNAMQAALIAVLRDGRPRTAREVWREVPAQTKSAPPLDRVSSRERAEWCLIELDDLAANGLLSVMREPGHESVWAWSGEEGGHA